MTTIPRRRDRRNELWNQPTVDMAALVDALEPERREPEVAYEFSNGRKFRRTDDPYAGVKGA